MIKLQPTLKNVTNETIRTMQEKCFQKIKEAVRSRHDTLQMIELRRLTRCMYRIGCGRGGKGGGRGRAEGG